MPNRRPLGRYTVAAAMLWLAPTTLPAATAFPGAVGQGAASVGGRGGEVYHVTTLEDYHPKTEKKIEGSLRHAIRAEMGPRSIVFDVSGVIHLRAPLEVRKDRVTIAGQTSPGGITLYGYPFEVSGARDVVVRHLRVRCGDLHAREQGETVAPGHTSRGDLDASSANAVHVGHGAERVVLDHLSTSWGMDETLSVTRARDVTVQHCLIGEALDESLHAKGAHGYGSLVRGELSAEDQRELRGGYTLFGNLWAHNRARNPSVGGSQWLPKGAGEAERGRADVNVVNNVVYDWGSMPTHRNQLGAVRLNLVGNYYVNGVEKKSKYLFRGGGDRAGVDYSPTEVFQRDNRFDRDQDNEHYGLSSDDPEHAAQWFQGFDDDDTLRSTGEPFGFYGRRLMAATRPAAEAYEAVLAGVGASLWRDAVDRRIVQSLRDRDGRNIDSQEEHRQADGVLPGVDDLEERHRPDRFDTDRDGVADAYEREHGLDPSDPEDRNGTELAKRFGHPGLTNLEVYLHALTQAE